MSIYMKREIFARYSFNPPRFDIFSWKTDILKNSSSRNYLIKISEHESYVRDSFTSQYRADTTFLFCSSTLHRTRDTKTRVSQLTRYDTTKLYSQVGKTYEEGERREVETKERDRERERERERGGEDSLLILP